VLDRIEFEVTRQASTLDHYRRGWTPGPGVGLAGIWLGAVVSDASGQDYWGLRGTDDFVIGMTHVVSPVCGFRALQKGQKGLDPDSPHLFDEYSSIDWFEPFEYSDSGDRVPMMFTSGLFGRLTSDSSGKEPARSWCWVEYAGGMLTPELLDFVLQRFRLARDRR